MLKEVCASCLQPVYPLERVAADKVCVHRSCFCCQVCRRKLSLHNYAALRGGFYCQVHYKQMAAAKSRREMERLQHQLGEHQVQHMAMGGRGAQPQGCYNRARKETAAREKPTASNAHCSWWLAEPRQELSSRSVPLGNQLRTGWSPSETVLLAADGKTGNLRACSWKKPTPSLKSYQDVGSRAGKMVLGAQERKSASEAAVEKGNLSPGVSYTRKQGCSWPKTRGQRASEKIGDGDMLKGKQGGKVLQQVAAIQQGKAQLKKGPVSASSSLVLEPVKSLLQGSLVTHATQQSTKPTNWMYLGGTEGCIPFAAQLQVKADEVCGSLSTANEGGTTSAMTDDKPDLTIATPTIAGDRNHLGENSKQPTCVPGEPQTRNTTNTEITCRAEGVDPTENETEEAHCTSEAPRTPYVPSDSPEPGGLSVSPEIAELVKEKSKANTSESPEKEILASLGGNVQPSSMSHLPGIESKEATFEKIKEVKPISTSGFLEDPSAEHRSQKNTAEKSRVSSPLLPDDKTDDHSVSCLQESGPQGTCGSLITNSQEDILRHGTKSPGKDIPVSSDTPLKGTCATWSSHDEVNSSKSKDPRKVDSRNIFHNSEQPAKTLDSSKANASLDKSSNYPVGEENPDLKLPGESSVYLSRAGTQRKENISGQACREMLDKGFRFGKNPFTTLFGSEDKGSAPKNETTPQRKPTKPQSALVTLFGYSSEKKQSQPEKPARSLQQTNIDRPGKPQDQLSSSNQAKQKASKTDQLPKPGKMEIFPKPIEESSGGFLDSTEGKETSTLLLGPGTNASCDDKHERTEVDSHDQMPLNTQVWQQWDSFWPSVMPAQEMKKEAAITSEGGTNPLHPPSELIPAADNSTDLIREGNHHDAHLLEIQKPLSVGIQGTVMEEEVFVLPGSSEKLPKAAEFQSDSVDFAEDNNLFFSGGQDSHNIVSKTPHSDLENSEAETSAWFDPNLSELCQEIPEETKAPLALWDTSSLSLLAGQDEINIGDPEGIQSCVLLQQLDQQFQAPKAAEDPFEFGLSAEGSANKCFSTQGDSFPPVYMVTSQASETFNQGVFNPFHVDLSKMGQEAPEEMNRSRKTSGVGEDYESLSFTDLYVLDDSTLDQEFFI